MQENLPGFANKQPIIGVLHLRPLPGSPNYDGNAQLIKEQALADADTLVKGGVDAVMIENFGDTPYFPDRVPRETIAWMSRIGGLVRDSIDLPMGVCVLRNDARAGLAIAHSIEAQFIRVCVLGSPRVTDHGVIEGAASKLIRDRARMGAKVKIFADVDIKHSYPLSSVYSIKADAMDLVARSHADALIVTGPATGVAIADSDLAELTGATSAPVFVGSGITEKNIKTLAEVAGGFIVGTSLKEPKQAGGRVSLEKVRAIVGQLRG
ncbi:BtpA/SgcQ family protein [Mesorhizobium sp. BE184]|uniref:BtpA/SgcQ family protein n=1 Tax=Mesorhizobium sp. BE184 TaxID=2817714 RepID=UPI002864CFD4|nr:BtpA/SgcQ family protein [Mesorhizobium sp. BE184]MDR7034584.1 membrane complex biogenesis BtpA family protein [Mesorhizobium sp. BE184]